MNFLAELNEIKGMSFNIYRGQASEIVGFRQSLRTNEQVANAKEREMRADVDDAISAYRSAYEAANGKALYQVWYDMGWVRIRTEPHGYIHKHRRKEIEAMTAVLRARLNHD